MAKKRVGIPRGTPQELTAEPQRPSLMEAQQTFLEKMDEFIAAVNRLADAVLQHMEATKS